MPTTFAYYLSIVLIGVVLGGLLSGCARQSTDSRRTADSAPAATRSDGKSARPLPGRESDVRKDQDSSRKSGTGCFDPIREVEVPCLATNPLIEAAREGDARRVKLELARKTDRKTLNEALFTAAGSAPLSLAPNSRKELKPNEASGLYYARIATLDR